MTIWPQPCWRDQLWHYSDKNDFLKSKSIGFLKIRSWTNFVYLWIFWTATRLTRPLRRIKVIVCGVSVFIFLKNEFILFPSIQSIVFILSACMADHCHCIYWRTCAERMTCPRLIAEHMIDIGHWPEHLLGSLAHIDCHYHVNSE